MDIGIDLGTTFSVIAVNGKVDLTSGYPEGIYLEDCDVTIIPTPYGEPTFPSVVMEDPEKPGEYLFGTDALQKAEEGLAPVMFSKRRMGTQEAIPLNDRTTRAKDVAREFLRYMKRCAEQALGQAVQRAVVTHPAYFDRGAVEETREAANEAGFDMSLPEQMLMEPVAAALTYVRTDRRDPLCILTYDLGGGTFDVTYLERRSGVINMRAFDGDPLMGGYNFDRELIHWVRQRLEAQGRRIVLDESNPADRGRLARLLRLAENVKIALSKASSDTTMVDFRGRDILVDVNGKPVQINERISREQFVEMIRPFLNRTVECCRRALKKAGVEVADVDEVLLVGGSTYGPWISTSMAAAFPNAKPKLFYPDLCVGAGAAIHAKMALPPLVRQGRYRLILDMPPTSVLDTLNITGQVTDATGLSLSEPLSVRLRLPHGSSLGPVELTEEGRFLFEAVELREEGSHCFMLSLQNWGGASVLEHAFEVLYAPESNETSTVTTVLPRPLYILTFDGLVPLAKEGATLPAKCSQTFQRDNDNPNLTIELFQEEEPIGEVRVENIPPEGGRGSFVELEVEVTEKNQIRGHATIRTREGRVLVKSDVSVRFVMPEIPSVDELRAQWEDLSQRFASSPQTEQAPDEIGRSRATELIATVERLFAQQPVEQQEIHATLRQLRHLLDPPADPMKPTRHAFLSLIALCRSALQEMVTHARGVLEKRKTDLTIENSLVASAQRDLQRAERYGQQIDKLEREGLEAHDRRDRRAWAHVHDMLTDIEVRVRKMPKIDGWPTSLLKMLAVFEVRRILEEFNQGIGTIVNKGRKHDWQNEIVRIERELQGIVDRIIGIDDALPSEQGRAQVRTILRSLKPLEEDIGKLGFDLSKPQK